MYLIRVADPVNYISEFRENLKPRMSVNWQQSGCAFVKVDERDTLIRPTDLDHTYTPCDRTTFISKSDCFSKIIPKISL
jgi:hypothetical protein